VETGASLYHFGQFTLDIARGAVLKHGQEIKLRPKVYEALKYLVENPGRLIGKQELIQAVWPDSFVTDDSLVQCTVELRRALEDREQQLLKTVPRRGYLFAAQVTRSFPADSPASERAAIESSPESSVSKLAKNPVDLPTPRTSLIGRDRETREAAELLLKNDVRLLSLTGAGGSGKTRLAIAVAATIAPKFPGGVQFVGLASLTRPDLVATAIAKALDLQETPNRTLAELIRERLQDSDPFLLVLDNFERVLAAAALVADILGACPGVKVMVTTRACLHIYGEQEFPVAPLEENAAVQLFVQRAAAVRPNFAVTPVNSPAIRDICLRLDGLPLAIELAAARTKLLSPSAILDRLQSGLQLLTGGALDLPERQQTLRNTIDWSHELLSEGEQRLFRRFAVFIGGGTLEAAEAVCNTGCDLGIDLFDGLSSLVDKNLIQRLDRPEAESRFTMLETIREYALERLAASGDESATRRAHAAYCLVLAEEGNPELSAEERSAWLRRCDLEIDNYRAALDWLLRAQELEWTLRLSMALFRFWDMREHLSEGRTRLESILKLTNTSHQKERAKICIFLGALSTAQGDFAAAEHFLQQSLRLYESQGDRRGIAASLNALGVNARDRGDYEYASTSFEKSLVYWRGLSDSLSTARCLHNLANALKVKGDFAQARFLLEEAILHFVESGDRSGAAWSINQEGDIAREEGDFVAAREFYERALKAFRETGDRWGSGRSLADLGSIYCEQGKFEAAERAYRGALHIFSELGHRRGIARALEGTACLAAARGQAERALLLAGAAAHLRRLIDVPLQQPEQSKLDQHLSKAWKSISKEDGEIAWARGFAMSIESALQYSLQEPRSTIAGSQDR
jgi:predicted ATPase/DNA-binding winged helix-turn-helix (wHTH) protein